MLKYWDRLLDERYYNDCPLCNFRGKIVHVGKFMFHPIESKCSREEEGYGHCGFRWDLVMTKERQQTWRRFFKLRGQCRIAFKKLSEEVKKQELD